MLSNCAVDGCIRDFISVGHLSGMILTSMEPNISKKNSVFSKKKNFEKFFEKFFFEKIFFEKTKFFFWNIFFINRNFITNLKKSQKNFFDKTRNHDVDYFTKTEKYYSGNGLKIINFIQTWPSDVKQLKTDCRTRTRNY